MEQPLKILIVDDDEHVLDALCCFLNNKDYDVTPASDGVEGLTFFENDPNGFDLIITDLVMPKMSGKGLISVIKEKLPDTPVIAMTGWGEYPGVFAMESQADRVLSKPFQFSQLEAAIEHLISSKS